MSSWHNCLDEGVGKSQFMAPNKLINTTRGKNIAQGCGLLQGLLQGKPTAPPAVLVQLVAMQLQRVAVRVGEQVHLGAHRQADSLQLSGQAKAAQHVECALAQPQALAPMRSSLSTRSAGNIQCGLAAC